MDKETQDKLQEMQLAEQNLQNLLLQKQSFQIELNELEASEEEVKKATGEMFKIAGNIMIKTNKSDVEKELKEKKEVLLLRIKTIEKQEEIFKKKLEGTRQDLEEKFKEDKKRK